MPEPTAVSQVASTPGPDDFPFAVITGLCRTAGLQAFCAGQQVSTLRFRMPLEFAASTAFEIAWIRIKNVDSSRNRRYSC